MDCTVSALPGPLRLLFVCKHAPLIRTFEISGLCSEIPATEILNRLEREEVETAECCGDSWYTANVEIAGDIQRIVKTAKAIKLRIFGLIDFVQEIKANKSVCRESENFLRFRKLFALKL